MVLPLPRLHLPAVPGGPVAVTDSASCPGMELVGNLSLFLQPSLLLSPFPASQRLWAGWSSLEEQGAESWPVPWPLRGIPAPLYPLNLLSQWAEAYCYLDGA